jgi:hypothetical protein
MAASVKIINAATPRLIELGIGLDLARINARIAPAVARLFQDHLAVKEAAGNKKGWPTQHFYARCARGITSDSDAAAAYVSVNTQGYRQRLEGGDIKPVNKKYLALPARSEAYGKRPEEFGNLEVVFGKRKDGSVGPVALAAKEGGATVKVFRGREASGSERPVHGANEGVIMYFLVKEVHQGADPSVRPTDEEIIDCAVAATEAYVRFLKRRQK